MKKSILWPLLILVGLLSAQRKNNSAGPNDPIPKSEVLKLTGNFEGAKLEEDVNIPWLHGPPPVLRTANPAYEGAYQASSALSRCLWRAVRSTSTCPRDSEHLTA